MEILAILIPFILILLDKSLATAKTVFISKEKYLTGAIFASVSTFFYMIALTSIIKDNSLFGIISVCVATLIGTYVPGKLIKRTEKDKLYIFDITGKTFEEGVEVADTLRSHNIAIRTEVAYDENIEKTLVSKVYCETKEDSKKVIDILEYENIANKIKWNVYIPLDTNR